MAIGSNIRAGRAYVEVVADSSKLQRSLTEAQAQLRAFGQSASALGKDLLALGGTLSVPLLLATKSFADFDDSMRLVQAVTQATATEFARLTQVAQELGRTTSYTAKQSADAMVALGRMGFQPREIEAAVGAVLNLARATGSELTEAADYAANSLRIFALTSREMTHVTDVLTATANGSAQTLGDLFEALKVAGPQAKAANESLEDTCAALGVLANMGIKGSLAGTALRKSFSQFAKSDVQATLGEWGIATVTATGDLRSLADILRDVAGVMRQMPTAERLSFAEEIFDLRGALAGLSLTGNIGDLDAMLAKLKAVDDVAAETARQMDAGLGGSFRLLASASEGAMNAFASQLSISLQPLIGQITSAINATTQWVERNGSLVRSLASTVIGVAGFGAACLALGMSARGIAATLSVVQGTLGGLGSAFSRVSTVSKNVVGAVTQIARAFRTYASTSTPVLVSTSNLLSALRLPIDRRANQIAASLLLMSRAETASAARSMLAAKWQATAAVLQKFRLTTLSSALALKAHALAEALAATGTKTLTVAKTAATVATRLFSGAAAGATLKSAANAVANASLAVSAKAVAAGYLAASSAARVLMAIPIAAIFTAAAAAVMGLYLWLSRAGKYTAQLSEKMTQLRESGDETRKTDQLRMQRLEQLAQKQRLSNSEMTEAERLTKSLSGRYGDLGISLDKAGRSLTMAADAQRRLTEAMRASAIAEVEAEIAEYEANIRELEREITANQHWSHYNLWSYISGGYEEAIANIQTAGEKQLAYMDKLVALRKRLNALETEGSERDLFGTDERETLQEAISNDQVTKETSQSDVDSAQKRAAEIERRLRRENQTELENEIEDICDLRDEYTRLIQTMLAFERSKRTVDNARVAELEEKLAAAEETAQRRIQAAQARVKAEDGAGVEEVKQSLAVTLEQTQRTRDERAFDEGLSNLQKTSPERGLAFLEEVVRKLDQTVEAARKAYEEVVSEVSQDGRITEDEQARVQDAQERYMRLENTRERYTGKLSQARQATEQAHERLSPALGSFYAKALQGLGKSAVQEKTLKATQETAQNTKKTVELLRKQATEGLVFK